MKAYVIYDSVYGNTEKVAQAIGEAIQGEVKVILAAEADRSGLGELDLLIVGTPIHGGRPTGPVKDFLNEIPDGDLEGVAVAAFDTRSDSRFARIFGHAAPKIADKLEKKGGTLRGTPEGFIVEDKEGPLRDGEMERAVEWARGIAAGRG